MQQSPPAPGWNVKAPVAQARQPSGHLGAEQAPALPRQASQPNAEPGRPLHQPSEEGMQHAEQQSRPCDPHSGQPAGLQQWGFVPRTASVGGSSPPEQLSIQEQGTSFPRTGSWRGREVLTAVLGRRTSRQQPASEAEHAEQRCLESAAMQAAPLQVPLAAHLHRGAGFSLGKSADADAPFTVHLHATSPP